MTREEHLKYCKVCINRKMDRDKGLVCGLSGEYASFESECAHFFSDNKERERVEAIEKKYRHKFIDVFVPREDYYATPILLYLNILVYILMVFSDGNYFAFSADTLLRWGANCRPLTLHGGYIRLILNYFLHIDIFHLISNLFGLIIAGYFLEPLIGPRKFISVYLLSGICASMTSLWWNDFMITLGASGPIFGLYGVLIILLLIDAIKKPKTIVTFVGMSGYVIYTLYQGIIAVSGEVRIDNAAHIGGLLSGVLLGLAIYPSLHWPKKLSLSFFTHIILAALIGSGSYYGMKKIPDNMTMFAKAIDRFLENEQEAMFIYNLSTYRYFNSYRDKIEEVGIRNWNKNINILKKLQNEAVLPNFHASKVSLLIDYCELRIKQYKLIVKSIDKNVVLNNDIVGHYDTQIDSIIYSIQAIEPEMTNFIDEYQDNQVNINK